MIISFVCGSVIGKNNLSMENIFVESIRLENGQFSNLPLHMERLRRTAEAIFGKAPEVDLTPDIVPTDCRQGLFKCRVIYSDSLLGIEYQPYRSRVVRSIRLMTDNEIDYNYKSTDRTRLNYLLELSGYDDILIVKNGYITDASSSNVVFEDTIGGLFTPLTCLLRGTKREWLLRQGIIREAEIKAPDIDQYVRVHLINAMINLGEISCDIKENVIR